MNIPICTNHAPWKAEFGGKKLSGWGVLSARDEVVAYIPQSIVHDEANARLISCAPEMLEALELIHANAAESPEWIRARLEPIIAKAKGQP